MEQSVRCVFQPSQLSIEKQTNKPAGTFAACFTMFWASRLFFFFLFFLVRCDGTVFGGVVFVSFFLG